MARINEQDFAVLISREYEIRTVEFKGPGRRDDPHFFARVIRAVLGMSNKRDGGTVIIGVGEKDGEPDPIGLTDRDRATWIYDKVVEGIAPYADPSVELDLELPTFNGLRFVVLRVHEFIEIPIICNKDYTESPPSGGRDIVVLRKGAVYFRSRRQVQTAEIGSHEDMRELLELATDKGVDRFIARAFRSRMSVTGIPETSDADRFSKQLGDLNLGDF